MEGGRLRERERERASKQASKQARERERERERVRERGIYSLKSRLNQYKVHMRDD